MRKASPSVCLSILHACLLWAAIAATVPLTPASAATLLSRREAVESITPAGVREHVAALADDIFEGREAGSRGGRAAGIYIARHLKAHGLRGGASARSYYQQFGAGYGNLLGLLPGSDPALAKQYLVVSAHYDHVGYGSPRNSYGPIGLIHNGADDNASGVAGLLELIEAFDKLAERPKRSILFAFWDGEEKGLLGSKYWLENPTVPLPQVPLVINMDMIGRLRANRVEVYGTRTMAGLRRMVSEQNVGTALNFTWEMKNNSDHFPFFERGIPVMMLHTGLHEDYHRPSDDVERINFAGEQSVCQLLLRILLTAADQPKLGTFREQSRQESPSTRQSVERPLAPLPGRLGVFLVEGQGGAILREVIAGTPAAEAGLAAGDRIIEVAGRKTPTIASARAAVLAAASPAKFVVERAGRTGPLEVSVALAGRPLRVGLAWRIDDAEPGTVALTRVVPGSPADAAGLKVHDRLYQVDGRDVDAMHLAEELAAASGDVHLRVERDGQVREVVLKLDDGKI